MRPCYQLQSPCPRPLSEEDLEEWLGEIGSQMDKVDQAEYLMVTTMEAVEIEVEHTFTPGLYGRLFRPKAGTLVTSKIHNTEHQYVVLKGSCLVWDHFNGVRHAKAGDHGITLPGTRRLAYVLEDMEWMTFHPTELTDLDEIEAAIIQPHQNPLLLNAN